MPSTLHRQPTSSLAFLAPGLLHQLGNQLFAAQGSAQLLPEASAEPKARILHALARGGDALRLLRALLGDPVAPALPIAEALAPLLDAARVSLRERGHQLVVAPAAGAGGAPIATGPALARTAEALSRLADCVPAGVTGRFLCATAAQSAAATVTVRFDRDAGSLPFPLATAAVCEGLLEGDPGAATEVTCRPVPNGLELAFPWAVRGANQEA